MDEASRWTLVTLLIAFVAANVWLFVANWLWNNNALNVWGAVGLSLAVMGASMALLVYRTRQRHG